MTRKAQLLTITSGQNPLWGRSKGIATPTMPNMPNQPEQNSLLEWGVLRGGGIWRCAKLPKPINKNPHGRIPHNSHLAVLGLALAPNPTRTLLNSVSVLGLAT